MSIKSSHWADLIVAIKRSTVFFILVFFICWYLSDNIYAWLQAPIVDLLPNKHLISISLVDTVMMPLHLALWGAGFLLAPYLIFECWLFVAPALQRLEKYLCFFVLLGSWLLFVLGFCFAYKVVFPTIFSFFFHHAPQGVMVMPDIMTYFDLCSTLLLSFGFAAQLPLFMLVLDMLKITSNEFWVNNRSFAILIAFIVGMLLTPPDVLSQVLLAIPLVLLYEFGILIIKLFNKHQRG